MKKILFAASEAIPFMKTGGLADVTGSLPEYFDKTKFDIRIILPRYLCIQEELRKDMHFICHFYVNLGWRKQYVGIFETNYHGITYYFIDNEYYFAGEKPYHNIYEDVEKFAFFSKSVLEALPYLDFCPELIHCHDWQTGLIPVFLHTTYGDNNYYAGMKTVLTIHNMKFQGRWKLHEVMDITGLPKQIFSPSVMESYGEANYLKGGIVYADAVTTVSPTYAHEITTLQGGDGLDGLMREVDSKLFGILNGIDTKVYNPETDIALKHQFDGKNIIKFKKENKKALQEEMGLERKPDAMLIGIVSRMTNQKGFDLIACVIEELMVQEKVQFVILGTGEDQYENMFRYFEQKYPNQLKANLFYAEDLAHRIYASSDIFLMPSLFEPCGLSQIMSMRYGTIPIVRETGGLRDTVMPYNEYEQTGTGFSFCNYNAHEMKKIICYALDVYKNHPKEWESLMRRAMQEDFSWSASAKKYEELYQRLLEN